MPREVPTVLVVDDEVHVLQLAQIGLGSEGFTVLTAASGAEGLEKATAELPDLVVLDVNLPDIPGLEVCRKLKASSATSAIPIVFLSAMGQEHHVEKGMKAGANDYVSKPFKVKELAELIRKVLNLPQGS